MWKLLTLLSLISVFKVASCNKASRFERKLNSKWKITSFEYTNPNGLSYFYPAEGYLEFEEGNETGKGIYTSDYYYIIGSDTLFVQESGSYEFNYDGTEFYDIIRTQGSTTDTIEKARILILTKKDLRTEMTEVNGRKSFVLEKMD